MPAFSRAKVLWTYTTDDGATSTYRATSGYTSQAAVGGAAWAGVPHSPLRRGFRPRCVYAVTAGGKRKKITIFDSAAFAAIVVNTTVIQVDVGDGQQTAATVRSREGEHHRGAGEVA